MTDWIACAERMPDCDVLVLVYVPRAAPAPIAVGEWALIGDTAGWILNDGEDYPADEDVTHWMPLPAVPLTEGKQ